MSGTMDHSTLSIKVDSKNLSTFGLAIADDPVLLDWTKLFAAGTGANQASQQWHSSARSIPASSSENLDLAGALTNAFGVVLTFTKIKALMVKAAVANVNDVLLGNGSNPFIGPFGAAGASIVTVKPGGIFIAIAPDVNGYAVTAATGDILKVANSSSGSAVVYDIFILGVD